MCGGFILLRGTCYHGLLAVFILTEIYAVPYPSGLCSCIVYFHSALEQFCDFKLSQFILQNLGFYKTLFHTSQKLYSYIYYVAIYLPL